MLRAVLAVVVIAGCAHSPAPPDRGVLLADTPFFPDGGTLCGPSALATIISHRGISVHLDELTEQIYLPGRAGTLQADMLGGIRRYGLAAVPLDPGADALVEALSGRDPVLVLLRLGRWWGRNWHYAVLIGYDAGADQFVLRSGRTPDKRMSRPEFLRTWHDAEYWAYVAVHTDQVPDYAGPQDWLAAGTGLEQAGVLEPAAAAYASGAERWPLEPMFAFGRANVLFQKGQTRLAIAGYRAVLKDHPDLAPAWNNLAHAYGSVGCAHDGAAMLQKFLAGAKELDTGMRARLAGTLAELSEAGSRTADESTCTE